jgi:chemotaxis signal transduction protein
VDRQPEHTAQRNRQTAEVGTGISSWRRMVRPAFTSHQEITYCDKHHSLPHRKSPVLRGLVNVRGELLLCFSLGYLFKLQKSEKPLASNKTVHERYIVISDEQEDYTFPVSEVNNILRYDPELLEKPPATINEAACSFVKGIIKHDRLNIGILDSDLVFTALHRNI